MSDLRSVIDAVDVQEWLDAHGIDYKNTRGSSGEQLNVRECPVCNNTKWKTYLNAASGLGNCFSCGEKFNKWKFFRAVLGEVPTPTFIEGLKGFTESRAWRPKRVRSADVSTPEALELPDSYAIPHRGQNMKYLEDRGVTAELAEYFHLRYCNEGHYRYKFNGDWRFMPFSRRIIIPIYDLDGQMVTFQGRDTTGTAEKKYLFPSGLAVSGTQLYNGFNVRGTDRIVVGEGVFDVIAIKKAFDESPDLCGITAVGTFGKHLSWGSENSQQMKFLKLKERGVTHVTFMWDGEMQATRDAIDAAKRLTTIGIKVSIAMLPRDKDPAEVSGDVVRRAYASALQYSPAAALRLLVNRQTAPV